MELYHVLNRGVDKRQIFLDSMDHARFVHDLYEFNDEKPAGNANRIFNIHRDKERVGEMIDLRGQSLSSLEPRSKIVDIHGWCLMGNHYHLLLSERIEGGLTRFIMKLNVGYAKYFNEKYSRTGTLFQSRTKKVHIMTDSHFLYILHYIHLNPLDFLRGSKDWRGQEISDVRQALAHLDGYRWSSFKDYCGKKNFPSVINKDLLKDVFKDYRKAINVFLEDMDNSPLQNLDLE